MVRAMTERVQADARALSELAGWIGLLHKHITDGVRHLSKLLDAMDWDDDTYRTVSAEKRESRYWSMASKGTSIDHWLKCIAGEDKPTTCAA